MKTKCSINIAQNSCDALWLLYPEIYFLFTLFSFTFKQWYTFTPGCFPVKPCGFYCGPTKCYPSAANWSQAVCSSAPLQYSSTVLFVHLTYRDPPLSGGGIQSSNLFITSLFPTAQLLTMEEIEEIQVLWNKIKTKPTKIKTEALLVVF